MKRRRFSVWWHLHAMQINYAEWWQRLNGVSNHQPPECLLNRLFRHRSKKTSKLSVTGLCAGNSPMTGEFPGQGASNAENVSIWWRLHGTQHNYMYIEKWQYMRRFVCLSLTKIEPLETVIGLSANCLRIIRYGCQITILLYSAMPLLLLFWKCRLKTSVILSRPQCVKHGWRIIIVFH